MPTKPKINIKDNSRLREKIDELYEKASQIDLAKWSLTVAKHILEFANIDYRSIDELVDGFKVNELWQIGKVRMHDVRQASFKIHRIARECDSEIKKTALRVAGQAVASGHMKEHAMVASDYAVKTIGLITSNDIAAITSEREWQLNELKIILQSMNSHIIESERTSRICDKCGNNLYLSYKHDALFCPKCNKWKEKACDDPNCEYCSGRPDKPINTI